jgi:hypothetical protein
MSITIKMWLFLFFAITLMAVALQAGAQGGRHGGGGHFRGGWGGHHHGGWRFGFSPGFYNFGYGYGPGYYGGLYPWGGYYSYPPAIVTVPDQPPVYIQQGRPNTAPLQSGYWYYCNNPQGYYPTIRQCSSRWQPVAPRPSLPNQ